MKRMRNRQVSCVCPTEAKIEAETPKTNVMLNVTAHQNGERSAESLAHNHIVTERSVAQVMTSVLGNTTMLTFATALGLGFVAYSSTHIYVYFCAPAGIWGFVQSLVIMDSTVCQAIMGLVHHSQSLYGAMMVGLLFSVISGIGKVISRVTGEPAGAIPTVIQSRPIRRSSL